MLYEVELKFPLADNSTVLSDIAALGGVAGPSIEQVDHYFNHPSRDFRQTNEAFRIRSVGADNYVTYKGPVIDRSTKMRREIEIPIAGGISGADQMCEMLTLLGFRSVARVKKTRTPWKMEWESRQFELAFDMVPSIGAFLEIELVVDESGRDAARDAILSLAKRLSLSNSEQRSYLELVLSQRSDIKSTWPDLFMTFP